VSFQVRSLDIDINKSIIYKVEFNQRQVRRHSSRTIDSVGAMNASRLARLLDRESWDGTHVRSVYLDEAPTIPPSETKTFPDTIYQNYYPLGLSLSCTPELSSGSSSRISHIDIYNPPSPACPPRKRRKDPAAAYACPRFPITFDFPDAVLPTAPDPSAQSRSGKEAPATPDRPIKLLIDETTSGRDFVAHFGKPSKKSEGQPGYVPPFLEWEGVDLIDEHGAALKIGIMVELRDAGETPTPGAAPGQGAGVWDRAQNWSWSTLKLFSAGVK
jgi:hypothetical protein